MLRRDQAHQAQSRTRARPQHCAHVRHAFFELEVVVDDVDVASSRCRERRLLRLAQRVDGADERLVEVPRDVQRSAPLMQDVHVRCCRRTDRHTDAHSDRSRRRNLDRRNETAVHRALGAPKKKKKKNPHALGRR
eukprot:3654549-Prymnesium_polylepis.1